MRNPERCATAEEAAGWLWRCNSDGRCIRREKSSGIGSSSGRTYNTGVIGLRWHCRRPAARPDARHGVPAVYENNISFCVAMIDIYSSVRPGIALWKSPRNSPARTLSAAENLDVEGDARLADICATSRCRMTDLDDCKDHRFIDSWKKNPEDRPHDRDCK